MAIPSTFPYSTFLIQLGDGNSPEVFDEPCVFVSKAFNQSAATIEDAIPDCDDPDAPAQVNVAVDSLKREITGSGKLGRASRDVWQDWFDSGAEKNIHVVFDVPLVDGGGYFYGPAILSQFNIKGDRKKALEFDSNIMMVGAPTWVPAAS